MSRGQIQARLDEVKRRLEMYYRAEAAILEGAQSYQIGSRQLTRATLPAVQAEIRALEKRKQELETALATGAADKRKSYRIIFRDL
jgi:hypothetical protein